MWHTIEQYQDLVTNGLDLLSFLLVTPELLRFSQPFVGALTNWAGGFIFSISSIGIWASFMETLPISILASLVLFTFVIIVVYYRRTPDVWWGQKGPTVVK